MPSHHSLIDHEKWIAEYLIPRAPELVASYRDALRIYVEAVSASAVRAEDVAKLAEYCESKRTPLSENVAEFLGELRPFAQEVDAAIRRLAGGKQVHMRLASLIALDSCEPSELHVELLTQALKDRSARIRTLAAAKISGMRLVSVLPALEAAISVEGDETARESLIFSRDLLVDGFHVRNFDDASVWVSCQFGHGSLTSRTFKRTDLETEVPAWVASIRGTE
jgi:hypothetical protein